MCFCESFLFERNVAETPPSVIMRLVSLEGSLVAFLTVVVVFICHKFMAAESVSVSEILVKLDGSSEKFKSCLVLFEQTITVSDHAPCLRSKKRLLDGLVAEEDQCWLVLEVP